ncbi:hypothetical protein EYZ11_008477 [Aspergillus tanneri]|uniref:Restriction endonuclease type IV Mrr domain-containing protein n=1 Tax=Aspergillus tanneri TaxID=1220188 RepID=A0A4S3JAB5_9EURO|nr:uncharacterized protein ATNIH1004_008356 [Aspergillus tanneri]KAA8644157.1 hypothetical protein ATNIH1004_008356 [Aspergillus tanneri]THC92039.1 hypothetical protein EYZ11_008477 [Aspergillus tanneri]
MTLLYTRFNNSNHQLHSTRQLHSLTRRLFKLPIPPTAPSQHHDLTSFLHYAQRQSLSPTTTTYIGTHYEYTVQEKLRAFSFDLTRTGGRDDLGIDLLGTFHPPSHEHPFRVLVQCKSLRTKLGPNLVRELEGTFARAPRGWGPGTDAIGILVSPREATRGVRDALARSASPILWLTMQRDGWLRQALWNARAQQLGLGPLGVQVRYDSVDGGEMKSSVVLTWDGEDLMSMDQTEDMMLRVEEQWWQMWRENEYKDGDDTSGYTHLQVLEAMEQLFPQEKPLLYGDSCSSLSREDRERVMEWLRLRIDHN